MAAIVGERKWTYANRIIVNLFLFIFFAIFNHIRCVKSKSIDVTDFIYLEVGI